MSKHSNLIIWIYKTPIYILEPLKWILYQMKKCNMIYDLNDVDEITRIHWKIYAYKFIAIRL